MRWFWYILFPPYGLYVMWFKRKVKWFIKVPITLAFFLILILAIDQQLNPYRVEEHLSYEALQEELENEEIWHVERLDAFPYDEKTFVLYEVYVDHAMYHGVMEVLENKKIVVDGIYQVYPDERWIKQDNYSIDMPPIVALALYQSTKVSNDWSWEEEGETIQFDDESLTYEIVEEKTVELLTEKGEIYDSIQIAYPLPEIVHDYFKKHKEELGVIKEVVDHTVQDGMDSFYIQTNQHLYRVDRYESGDINLLKAEGL